MVGRGRLLRRLRNCRLVLIIWLSLAEVAQMVLPTTTSTLAERVRVGFVQPLQQQVAVVH
jgi:hypothetical protein